MSRRFFSDSPISGSTATLTGPEAHHLTHVIRCAVGDQVVLFDGSGAEFTAEVRRCGRSEVQLGILQRREADRELPFQLTVAAALPKGDRQRWLVEKLVELGVARLVPLITARGVAQPGDKALERLRRSVVEASKQCGRNRLMQVAAAERVADFFASLPPDTLAVVAHPEESLAAHESPAARDRDVVLAVGPEGGFTSDEVSHAEQSGWQRVSLGPRILRTETAAVALAAWLVLDKTDVG